MTASCTMTPFAVTDGSTTLTADELDEALTRLANGLVTLSNGRADPVAVVAENCVETLLVHAAAHVAGVTAVAVNPRLTADELAYVLDDCRAAAILTDGSVLEFEDRTVESWAAASTADRDGIRSWDWLSRQSLDPPRTDLPPRHPIVYTSGTTGRPKGTKLILLRPAATIAAQVADMTAHAAASGDGPHLVVGPLHHASPLLAVRYVLARCPVVVLPWFDPVEMLTAIHNYGVASTMVVPTHLTRLVKLPPDTRTQYDVSSLRWVAHTGAPCPHATKRAIIEWFGPVVVEIYGGSECGVIAMIDSEEWLAKPGSVGRPIRRFEPVVVSDDGEPLAPGQVGRLYFRDRIGRGVVYEGDPEKTAQAHLEPGVFTLGELGYVDADGYLFIADRRTDLILCGGANVYPAEVELALIDHPEVADAVVVGMPDEDLGEVVHAVVQARDPASPPSLDSLAAHCEEHLAPYKRPRSYAFVDEVPRSAMGKADRRLVRERESLRDRGHGRD